MIPLTSQAFLRGQLLPSAAPILHMGSDYLAMIRIGHPAAAAAAATAATTTATSAAAAAEDQPLSPAAGCLGVLQRRQRLLHQQLQQIEKEITASRLLLGDAGASLWQQTEAAAATSATAAAAAGAAGSSSSSNVQITPEGFVEIREQIPDELTDDDILFPPPPKTPAAAAVAAAVAAAAAAEEQHQQQQQQQRQQQQEMQPQENLPSQSTPLSPAALTTSSSSSSSSSDGWVRGIRDVITERVQGAPQGSPQPKRQGETVAVKRPLSKFKQMMMKQQNQQQTDE